MRPRRCCRPAVVYFERLGKVQNGNEISVFHGELKRIKVHKKLDY